MKPLGEYGRYVRSVLWWRDMDGRKGEGYLLPSSGFPPVLSGNLSAAGYVGVDFLDGFYGGGIRFAEREMFPPEKRTFSGPTRPLEINLKACYIVAHITVLRSSTCGRDDNKIWESEIGFPARYKVAQKETVMSLQKDDMVRARINGSIKAEAEAVLAAIGLTTSDAFRLMMMRIAAEKALPFNPLIPNEETIEAMRASRRGEFVHEGTLAEFLEDLDEEN